MDWARDMVVVGLVKARDMEGRGRGVRPGLWRGLDGPGMWPGVVLTRDMAVTGLAMVTGQG